MADLERARQLLEELQRRVATVSSEEEWAKLQEVAEEFLALLGKHEK